MLKWKKGPVFLTAVYRRNTSNSIDWRTIIVEDDYVVGIWVGFLMPWMGLVWVKCSRFPSQVRVFAYICLSLRLTQRKRRQTLTVWIALAMFAYPVLHPAVHLRVGILRRWAVRARNLQTRVDPGRHLGRISAVSKWRDDGDAGLVLGANILLNRGTNW